MKIIKKIVLIGCVSLFTSAYVNAQRKTEWITLKGQLKGFSNQTQIEDFSEFQYLLPPSAEWIIIPEANGDFSVKFKAIMPNYYRLGRNCMYLSPGDHMEVFIDLNDPGAASFKGLGAEANRYTANTPFPKGGSFLEAGRLIKNTPEETIAAVEAAASLRTKDLAEVKNVSKEFKRLETARIKADLINSLMRGVSYGIYQLRLKDAAANAYRENYNKIALPKIAEYSKGFTDASLMKLVVYHDIAEDVIKQGGKPGDIQAIKDWYAAGDLVKEMQKTSDKVQLAAFRPKIDLLKTERYKTAVNKMLEQLNSFGKGDVAADFTALDMAGNAVKLSSLKGKVIYVDIWATWCGPCLEEMPHYEALKAKYKDNPDVVFVSLSIDDTQTLWKQSVNSRKADGYQWQINRSNLKAYNIVGIPRGLLIDKNFKMIDMNAPMPSEAGAAKAIDQLLQ